MYTETTESAVTEFDINDPALGSYVPDEVDPGAIPERTLPPPPDDGIHPVVLRLDDGKEGGPVYLKGTKDPSTGAVKDAKLIAAVKVRVLNEDGTEGQYLKAWYPTSIVFKGQKSSAISGLCYLSGRPFAKGALSLGEQKSIVERLFAEAGEDGVHVKARTRWIKSVPKADPETGLYVYKRNPDGSDLLDSKGNPIKDYHPDIKGQKRIQRQANLEALNYVSTWQIDEFDKGTTPEQFQKLKDDYVKNATENCHLFADPVSGEALQVQCEIDQLVEE